jgi:hypothetical protein
MNTINFLKIAFISWAFSQSWVQAQVVQDSREFTPRKGGNPEVRAANRESYKKELIEKNGFLAGDYVTETAYDDFFAVRNDAHERTFRYRQHAGVSSDSSKQISWYVNVPGKKGIVYFRPAGVDQEQERLKLFAGHAADIPTENFIKIKNSTGYLAVIYSAPDCPYCIRLESELEKRGISYIVAPTGLTEKSEALVKQIYCSEDAALQWKTIMARKPPKIVLRADCKFPLRDIDDFGFVFHQDPTPGPSTPFVVFRDGIVAYGGDVNKIIPMFTSRLGKKIFFN